MERQRDKTTEVPKELREKADKELEELRKELHRLKELKQKKEIEKQQSVESSNSVSESPQVEKTPKVEIDEIDNRLEQIDNFLMKHLEKIDQETYEKHAEEIESELQKLEQEIVGEEGVEKITPYQQLLKEYPWIEEKRYEFMYTMPDKKKQQNDYESWKTEWSKVLFDYARCAILHIIYLKQIISEKPFSNFTNRQDSVKEIAQKLIENQLAKWLSKKLGKLRVFWKPLEVFAENIYKWALDNGKIEPIALYEIREAGEDFSTLPKEDIEDVFKILEKENRATVIKENDQLILKVLLE